MLSLATIKSEATLLGRPFPENYRFDRNVLGDSIFDANSIAHSLPHTEIKNDRPVEPSLMLIYDVTAPSDGSLFCFVHNNNNSNANPFSSGDNHSSTNAYNFDEEWLQHRFAFVKKALTDDWQNRDQGKDIFNLVESHLNVDSVNSGIPVEIQSELDLFAEGTRDSAPSKLVTEMATRLVKAAAQFCEIPDISFDIDGELSFDLRLRDGRLILAELAIDGSIDASVYDEGNTLLKRMPLATEPELIAVLNR